VRIRLVAILSSLIVAATATLPAVADAPAQRPTFVRLSENGPPFLAYDGGPDFDPR
jgi:hypothetical protein